MLPGASTNKISLFLIWAFALAIASSLVFGAGPVPPAAADPPAANPPGDAPAPFVPGERLEFQLRWTVVPAGKAVMEVMPMKTIDGSKVYHFRLTARSNGFVDMFFKVRDCIDAYATADMTHAVRYSHQQHEGKTRRQIKVDFDWNKEMAIYNDGGKDRQVDVLPGTFDPLSVFYKTRMAEFRKDGMIQCPVSDGKKCVTGMAHIVKKEMITTSCGTYETYLLEPDLRDVGGVFEKDKNAKIRLWVTADERRMPVKIASKVAVGSFVGELISIKKENS
jgi:hypothetical protein